MSLHTLAGHMAAKGRNSDSMLVHMTPGEVQSLQALAKAHGTSLTINPDTGLPEAFKLKDLLPLVAGAVLGPAGFGLSATMAGVATGGLTALATGSLSRGLMAGLGAYGGAGLAGTLMDAGTAGMAAGDIAAQQGAGSFPTLAEGATAEQTAKYAAEVNAAREAALSKAGSAGFMDKASAGMSQMASKPGLYGKDLLMSGAAAASPILAGAMVPTTTGMTGAPQSDAYIRQKRFDPRTQTYTDLAPVKASEWGGRSFQSMAQGGIVALADGGMSRTPATMEQIRDRYAASGGSPNYVPYTPKSLDEMNTKYPNTGGSKQAYDYLMGKGVSTLVPYTPAGQIARPYRDVVAGVPVDTSNQEYIFDPVTRTYKLNPNYVKPQTKEEKAAAAKTAAEKAAAEKTAAAAAASAVARQAAGVGTSSGGGDSAAPTGPVDNSYRDSPFSLTGGIVPALVGTQAPAPVESVGTYYADPSTGLQGQGEAGQTGLHGDKSVVDVNGNVIGYDPSIYGSPADQAAAQAAAEAAAQAATTANDIDAVSASEGFSYGGGDNNGSGGGGTNDTGGDGTGSGANGNSTGDCVDPAVLIMLGDKTYVPAGSIKVGDVLFTMHESTHEFGLYPVEHAEEVQQPKAVVTFHDGTTMTTSHSHKFFMTDGSWKQVYQLNAGDVVKAAPGNNDKTVTEIAPVDDGPVMKITVKDAHTYVSEGLISHNMKARGGRVRQRYALGGMTQYATGGISSLGGYSDGGQLLRGPGDGVSDSIPARIGKRQEARLADGEFVVPARIVSELGNGSTEAGARQLYAMMDRIQANRKKTVGKNKVAVNSRADKYLPA